VKNEEIDEVLKDAGHALPDLTPVMQQRISELIQPPLSPVRPLPPQWAMTAGLLLICMTVSLAGAARAGFFGIELMDIRECLLIFPALAILVWVIGVKFIHEMIPGSLRRVSPGVLMGSESAVLLALFAFLFRDHRTDHFVSAGIACLLTGLLYAIPTALLGWLLLRRGFAVNPIAAGLAAGTLGGLAGVGMLELHCPNFQAAHVLVWHTAVVPLSGGAGALVAWALRFRALERS
jgi:hypothetical protein